MAEIRPPGSGFRAKALPVVKKAAPPIVLMTAGVALGVLAILAHGGHLPFMHHLGTSASLHTQQGMLIGAGLMFAGGATWGIHQLGKPTHHISSKQITEF